jgi:hypothetical protein
MDCPKLFSEIIKSLLSDGGGNMLNLLKVSAVQAWVVSLLQ